MSSELKLIERVSQKLPSCAGGALRLGVGDDAAILRPGNSEWVVTTDAFLEDVHFFAKVHVPEDVGYKALARAASDLAAMGAAPGYFLMNMALPRRSTGKWLEGFLAGMSAAARKFGLTLIGGDTTKAPKVAINLTLLGTVAPGTAVLRSGARVGDLICVSGRLGEAELGLQLIQRNLYKRPAWRKLLKKHLKPEPRLALGQWLSSSQLASSMIDTSDGLSTDLAHICEASEVGARIYSDRIPKVIVPSELLGLKPDLKVDPLRLALDGGEDYELLFTVPRRLASGLPRMFRGLAITVIGEATKKPGVLLVSSTGRSHQMRAQGWDPFRTRTR